MAIVTNKRANVYEILRIHLQAFEKKNLRFHLRRTTSNVHDEFDHKQHS